MKIDPLNEKLRGDRVLSDKGIKQAIYNGLIDLYSDTKMDFNSNQFQPATLDLLLSNISFESTLKEYDETSKNYKNVPYEEYKIKRRGICSTTADPYFYIQTFFSDTQKFCFNLIPEFRSSLKRLGIFKTGRWSILNDDRVNIVSWDLFNYSFNEIHLNKNERFMQLFFQVLPFLDKSDWYGSLSNRKNSTEMLARDKQLEHPYEIVRSLDMGIEITTNKQLIWLEQKGYLEVKPKLRFKNGRIFVHASDEATKIKRINEPIIFSEREKYFDKLYENIKLKKNHIILPNQHLDIKTIETFKLSKHVGIQFYANDNKYHDERECELKHMEKSYSKHESKHRFLENIMDGWVDPGYEGSFSRQPKWFSSIKVSPGDIIGYGRVIFYPNGVERPYGSKELGSQYQNSK